MRFPPEIYLIGAQKAGTTTLAYLLDQYPQITVSHPKEPHFFTHNWDKELDWYRAKFAGSPDSVLLDASTTYTMARLKNIKGGTQLSGDLQGISNLEGVPKKVFSVNPQARFIYLLRDPVERTYSSYWFGVRHGIENREFGAVIRNGSRRVDMSDYCGQLSLWLDYFPLDSFLFLLFEDMKESPEHAARECFEFILGKGQDAPPVQLDSVKNQSYVNSRIGRRVANLDWKRKKLLKRRPGLAKAWDFLNLVVPKVVTDRVQNAKIGSKPIPPMKEEDRDFLVEYFYERNRNLERLIGISLNKWQA